MASKKVKLFNNGTASAESVPEDQVSELVRSGSHKFVGGRIPVVSPDGEDGTIDASEVNEAIAAGFNYDTSRMQAERKIMQEYDDKNIEAGLAGIARGLSFGLSDPLLTKSGLADPEHLRRLEEANPYLSGASEGAGIIASVIATGGTGAAAQTAGAATRATVGAGKIAERATAKALSRVAGKETSKSLAGKLAEKTIPTIAGGAVEGGLIGAGELLSEEALGRADFNAENLLGTVGVGAVLGGSGNLLFKGLETAVPAAVSGVKKAGSIAKDKLFSTEKAAIDLFRLTESRAAFLANKRGVSASKLADVTHRKLMPTKGKDFVTHFDEVLEADTKILSDIYRNADEMIEATGISVKVLDEQRYAKLVQDAIDDIAPHTPSRNLKQLRELRNNILEGNFLKVGADPRDLGLGPLQSAKRVLDKVDDLAKHDKLAQPTAVQKAAKDLRQVIREDINTTVETFAKEEALDPALRQTFGEIRQRNSDMNVMLNVAEDVHKKDTQRFTKKLLNFETVMRVLAGGMVFDTVGMLAGAASALRTVDAAQLAKLKLLAKIEDANLTAVNKAVGSIKKFSGVTKAPARIPVVKGLSDISFDPEEPEPKDKDRASAFKRLSSQLDDLSDPMRLVTKLEKRMETLSEVAPNTAQMAAMRIMTGVQFLQSKLPRDPNRDKYLNPAHSNWKPSAYELDKFERYVAAVENPLSVLEQFSDGIVNREGLEAVQTVYPTLFEDFKSGLTIQVAQLETPLAYQKRLLLRNAIGIVSDPTVSPDMVMQLQASYLPQPEEQAQMGPTPSSKINTSNLTTDTQDTAFDSELA